MYLIVRGTSLPTFKDLDIVTHHFYLIQFWIWEILPQFNRVLDYMICAVLVLNLQKSSRDIPAINQNLSPQHLFEPLQELVVEMDKGKQK